MLIPKGCSFKDFEKVVVANDFHLDNYFLLEEIMDFIKVFESHAHFVHVSTHEDSEFEYLQDNIERTILAYGDPRINLSMVTTKGNDVISELFTYVDNLEADLIIFVAQSRSFWNQVVHKSMTKKALLESKIPVLVFHSNIS